MNECFYIFDLFTFSNEKDKIGDSNIFYALSTEWFEKWKAYVNYDYILSKFDLFLSLNDIQENKENFVNKKNINLNLNENKIENNFEINFSRKKEKINNLLNENDIIEPNQIELNENKIHVENSNIFLLSSCFSI